MKSVFLEKPHQPFFITAVIALGIAIFFIGAHPGSVFDVSIFNIDINIAFSTLWFILSGYLFLLTGIYYVISMTSLKSKKWLVISHYVFITLFLIFFIVFSSFTSDDMKTLTEGIPFLTLIAIYSIILFCDMIFFILGVLFLFINLIALHREKPKS